MFHVHLSEQQLKRASEGICPGGSAEGAELGGPGSLRFSVGALNVEVRTGVLAASLGRTSGELINVSGSGFGLRQSLAEVFDLTFAGWNAGAAPEGLRAATSQVQLSFASAYSFAPQVLRTCAEVRLWTPALVTCRAPPGAGGANNSVGVTVSASAVANVTSAPLLDVATGQRVLFAYARGALSGAAPAGGPAVGNFSLTLRGSNLANGSVVIPPTGSGGSGGGGGNATLALSAAGRRLASDELAAAQEGRADAVAPRRTQGGCTGSTYSYGGACASCDAMGEVFLSTTLGCTPTTGPTDTAFYVSGRGVNAFPTTSGLWSSFPPGPFQPSLMYPLALEFPALTALAPSPNYLAAPGSSAPSSLPTGNASWSECAWVKCAAPSTYASVLEWGAAGDSKGGFSPQAAALVVSATSASPRSFLVSTLAGGSNFNSPLGAAYVPTTGSVVVPDGSLVRLVSLAGAVSTLAGSSVSGTADGQGAAASFKALYGAAWIQSPGVVVLVDGGAAPPLRLVSLSGLVSTLSITLVGGANFDIPQAVAVDPSSSLLYVANTYGHNILRVTFPAGVVTVLAGSSGSLGFADGAGTNARFNWPQGLAVAPSFGGLVVTDSYNHRIRLVTPAGDVSTLAGSGSSSSLADGTGTNAAFWKPAGAALAPSGEVVVTDTLNGAVRLISPSGVVTTILGAGHGLPASTACAATGVDVVQSTGVIIVTCGSILSLTAALVLPACDSNWHHVALTYSQSASPLQLSGFVDGALVLQQSVSIALPPASAATLRLGWSGDMSFNAGSLFVGTLFDPRVYNRTLSSVEVASLVQIPSPSPSPSPSQSASPSPSVPASPSASASATPLSPSPSPSSSPRTICIGSTYSYGSSACAGCDIGAAFISATLGCAPFVAPSDTAFYLSGTRTEGVAAFIPTGPASFVQDHRGVVDGALSLPGSSLRAPGAFAPPSLPSNGSVAFSAAAWINCAAAQVLPKVALAWGAGSDVAIQAYGSASSQAVALVAVNVAASPVLVVVTTLAGQGSWGFADGNGSAALFSNPRGIAIFPNTRNLVVADELNNCIRLVSESGAVTTLASNFNHPLAVAVEATTGYVAVADSWNNRIRLVSPSGGVSTLAGSGSIGSADGTGVTASFSNPSGIAFVPSLRSFVVSDTGNNLIRLISPSGAVTTLAGGNPAALQDGMGTSARFSAPYGIAVIPSTEVIIVADIGNDRA